MLAADRPLRALVVEDERLARIDLVSLLREQQGVMVVGEASTVNEGSTMIQRLDPDVVFLDVRLGEQSGFQLLDHCADRDVVFVTAYEEYAVKAFEANALDYLLKPVSADRLSSAIARLRESRDAATPARPLAVGIDDRLFLRLDDEWSFIRVGDIIAIHADGKESLVDLVAGIRRRSGKPMAEWASRLPEPQFARIHRSTIVQVAQVVRVAEWSHYSYLVHLRGVAEPVVMSRRHATRLKQVLG